MSAIEKAHAIVKIETDHTEKMQALPEHEDYEGSDELAMISAIATTLAEDGDIDVALDMLSGLAGMLSYEELEMSS